MLNYWLNEYRKRRDFHRRVAGAGTAPTVMQVELTNRCLMNCVMCPRQAMARPQGDMPLALFRKIVPQLAPYTRFFWLHGFGDPLLHPELPSVLETIDRYRLRGGISTNPVMLTPEKERQILDGRLHTLVLSLDGIDRETFKKVRGRDDFQRSVEHIERFLATHRRRGGRPHTILSIIKMDATAAQTAEFKRHYLALGADEIWIKPFVSWDGSLEAIKSLAECERSDDVKAREKLPCLEPWLKVAVLWDGRVVPCCYDFDGKYVLGDLNTQTLQEIWDGERMRKLREAMLAMDFKEGQLCCHCTADSRVEPRPGYPWDVPLRLLTRKLGKQ